MHANHSIAEQNVMNDMTLFPNHSRNKHLYVSALLSLYNTCMPQLLFIYIEMPSLILIKYFIACLLRSTSEVDVN